MSTKQTVKALSGMILAMALSSCHTAETAISTSKIDYPASTDSLSKAKFTGDYVLKYDDIKTVIDLISWIASVSQDEFKTVENLNRMVTEVSERIRLQEMLEAVAHEPQSDN